MTEEELGDVARETVRGMAQDIVMREGGLAEERPSDPGGITKHGVSLRYAKGIGLDLDGDGDTDADDIRLVTPDVAVDLFVEDFYDLPRLDRLPPGVRPITFDAGVLSGPPRAIMFVQRAINALTAGKRRPLSVDGVIGPKTRRAAADAWTAFGPTLVNAIVNQRTDFYRWLVEHEPWRGENLRGWIRRAEGFRVKST